MMRSTVLSMFIACRHAISERTRRAKRQECPSSRRAVAMLLVLICMAAATITTTAYLASRDNSAAIGENVANAAAARWGASSGLDLALATLKMNAAWCDMHNNGTLYENVPLAGSLVTVRLTDFLTDELLDSCSEYVTVTAVATAGGVEQTMGALVYFSKGDSGGASVDLSEFAVFVSTSLELRDTTMIARWPMAPLSKLGERIALGLNSTLTDVIRIRDASAAFDVTAYRHPDASFGYLDHRSGPAPYEVVLPDRVPFPAAPPISSVPPTVSPTPSTLQVNSGTSIIPVDMRVRILDVRNPASLLHLQGDLTLVVEQNAIVANSGKILVDGNVRLIVFGNLLMDSGAIELTDGSQLTVFVRGGSGTTAMEIRNSYVGNVRADNVIDTSGHASWLDPSKVTFYSVAGTSRDWYVIGNSAVKGSLYAPDATSVRVENTSAIYGRVAGRTVRLSGSAAIFYDPGLNKGDGFTNTESALYDEDGRLKEEFRLLASLDPLVVEPLANTTRTVIKVIGRVYDGGDDDGGDIDGDVAVTTMHYDPLVFGSEISIWEGW